MTCKFLLVNTLLVVLFLSSTGLAQTQVQLTRFSQPMKHSFLNDQGALESRESVFAADSGSMIVLENRKDPDSRQIRIPILRIKSLDTSSHTPVFWLSGGPGQSNLHSSLHDFVLSRHDHVMVGYRGVDGEASLNCPEVIRALEDAGDILSGDAIAAVSTAFGSCAGRISSQGIDLSGYTVADVVDDIEETRKALGYDKINLLSESYGTRVAYLYALKYGDRIDRMIMIGANPPGGMVWNPYQNDSLLVRYGELWKQDPDSRAIHPDLVEAFRTVNRNFPKRWLFFPIHEGTVKASVNAFLFHKETAAQAFDAYAAAANGDASGLWLISFIGGRIFPDIVNWGENASKAVSLDFDSTRDYLHELNPPDALIGAPLGAFLWAPAQKGDWPVTMVDASLRRVQRCAVSTLFLSGSLDFSTPAENVERFFMPNFPNGHHVVLSEAGHVSDLWQSQPAATHRLLTTFLETGTIDTSLVRYAPVSFEVSWGFPLVAKLLVGGAIVVLLAAVWGGWKIGKRFRWKGSKAKNGKHLNHEPRNT
jgi:pimeloyl-ACP methyl ester carboxylesterase